MIKTTPRTFVFIFFLISLPLSSLSQSNSVYDSFLKCFSNETKLPQSQITDDVYSQSNPSFSSVLRAYISNWRFKTSSTPKPTIIITPRSESHVSAAVICSKTFDFVLKIRSGGHDDYDGLSYYSDKPPFLILDLSNLRDISVDVASNSAWISAGATLREVYYSIWEKSKIHAVVCPTVGVGGHLSSGGYGNMLRKHGFSYNLIDAKIVDVNGRILDRKAMGENLFWTISGGVGGGGSYSVVLGYKVKLVPVPSIVTVFRVEQYMDSEALDLVDKWQSVGPKTDPNLYMRVLRNKVKTVRATVVALFLGRANEVVSLLSKEFPELGLKEENCTEMNWFQSTLWWDNNVLATQIDFLDRNLGTSSFGKRKSDYVETEIIRDRNGNILEFKGKAIFEE